MILVCKGEVGVKKWTREHRQLWMVLKALGSKHRVDPHLDQGFSMSELLTGV